MSEIIYSVHRCSTPHETNTLGDGTIWRCDCGFMWEFRPVNASYRYTEWFPLPKRYWNEVEQRPLNIRERWEADTANLPKLPMPIYRPTLIERISARLKGETE